MFLSIIIPLYNCEGFISECLDTILKSKFPKDNYEIIIINDGSRDLGAKICQRYAERHSHIRLLTQINKGASAARNAGLEVAEGDYVWFVDADDLIFSTFLFKAYQFLKEKNIELLCFNHIKIYSEHTEVVSEFANRHEMSGIDYFRGHYCNFIWNKIYKRSSLKSKRFLDGTKNIEDMLFNMITIIDMEHVLCVPEQGYKYNCTNLESTSRNKNLRNLVKLDQDSLRVLTYLNEFANRQSANNKKIVLRDSLNFSITGHLFSLFRFYSPNRLKRRIKYYRNLGLYPVSKSYNYKGNIFLIFANHESLFVNILRLVISTKHLVGMFSIKKMNIIK